MIRRDQPTTASWIGANLVGFTVGGCAAGGVSQLMHAQYVGISDSVDAVRALALSGATALACFGAAIGLSQCLTIYREVRSAGWWIPATALGWASAGGLAGGVSGLVGGSVTGVGPQHGRAAFLLAVAVGAISIGVLPAIGQWLVLRGTSDRAVAWMPAHAAALAAGVGAAFPIMLLAADLLDLQLPSAAAWALAGAVLGLVVGVVTRPALVRILRRPIGAPLGPHMRSFRVNRPG